MERLNYDIVQEASGIARYAFNRVLKQTKNHTMPLDDVNLVKRPLNGYPSEIDEAARHMWINTDPTIIRDEMERVAERAWFRSDYPSD